MNRLHIMVVKGVGKVRNFHVSPRLLWWSFLFLIVYMVVSAAVIGDYVKRRLEESSRAGEVQKLQREVEAGRKELYRAEQRVTLLEGYIERLESGEKPAEPLGAGIKEEPKTVPVEAKNPTSEKGVENPGKASVDIQEVQAVKGTSNLIVRFKVVNLQEGPGSLSGYVHVIATDRTEDPPRTFIYPEVAAREGIPEAYQSGQHFSIRNYKTLKAVYPAEVKPSSVKVLVYAGEGALLFEKEFEVEVPS